jgi:hypothetical protein
MKVTLATHGGLAAGINLGSAPKVLDLDALPQAAAEEVRRLIAAARAAPPAQDDRPGSARDAMSYTITVDDDGQPFVLRQSDTAMSPAFDALHRCLLRHLTGK